jgi:hypothetical protein
MTKIGTTLGRSHAAARAAFMLLAAIAVTLCTVAAPLGGTAHAGGAASSGVSWRQIGSAPVASGFSDEGATSGINRGDLDAAGSKVGGVGDGIQITGSKPSVIGGQN